MKKGNMYEWAKPWNPLGGECPHKCSYCSTNFLKQRYEAVRSKYSGPPQLYPGYPPASDKKPCEDCEIYKQKQIEALNEFMMSL